MTLAMSVQTITAEASIQIKIIFYPVLVYSCHMADVVKTGCFN